ncbi:hypothetical protein K1719_030839 [Acacia pycnantha]|nr:hypothetical protein K1719_030839 [Acacia pycnantha]
MMKNKEVEADDSFLPQEIIRDILIRLPVKSLIRFQCVCRHWSDLFKDPSFIADHLHHSNRQNPYILFQRGYSHDDQSDLYSLGSDMQVWRFQNPPLIEHLNHATEVWTVIPLPEQQSITVFQNLMVYEGKLALVFCAGYFERSAIHLWVREEGVGASGGTWNWTNKFTSNPYRSSGLFPKTLWGNEIFCRIWDTSTNTVLFNPTTGKFKKVNISKCDDNHQIFNYVESLVSIGRTKSFT